MTDEGLQRAIQAAYPKARFVAWRMLRNNDDVDDALQKARIKAFTTEAKPQSAKAAYNWFVVVVARCAIEVSRTRRRQPVYLEECYHSDDEGEGFDYSEYWESPDPGALELLLAQEAIRPYYDAMHACRPLYRQTIRDYRRGGLTTHGGGKVTGTTRSVFRSRLQRARYEARTLLQRGKEA